MHIHRLLLLSLFALFLTACKDGGNGGNGGGNGVSYIVWEGNVEGEWVSDANYDWFRFESDTGYMQFGNTVYYNAWVEGSNFYLNEVWAGTIALVEDQNGDLIAALVAPDNTLLDIMGTEDQLFLASTDYYYPASYRVSQKVPPVETAATQHELAVHQISSATAASESGETPALQKPQKSFPMSASNAFVGLDSESINMGILLKKP